MFLSRIRILYFHVAIHIFWIPIFYFSKLKITRILYFALQRSKKEQNPSPKDEKVNRYYHSCDWYFSFSMTDIFGIQNWKSSKSQLNFRKLKIGIQIFQQNIIWPHFWNLHKNLLLSSKFDEKNLFRCKDTRKSVDKHKFSLHSPRFGNNMFFAVFSGKFIFLINQKSISCERTCVNFYTNQNPVAPLR